MSAYRVWSTALLTVGLCLCFTVLHANAQSLEDSVLVFFPEWSPPLGLLTPEEKRQIRFFNEDGDVSVVYPLPDNLPDAAFTPGAAADSMYGEESAGKRSALQGYTAVPRGVQDERHYSPNVLLITTYPNGGLYGCSGTLIDTYHVLTAGHCTYKHEDDIGPAAAFRILPALWGHSDASGLTLDIPFGEDSTGVFSVFQGWTDDEDYEYDLAVIRLNKPLGIAAGFYGYGYDTDANLRTFNYHSHSYPGEDPFDGSKLHSLHGTMDDFETHFLVDHSGTAVGQSSGSGLHKSQWPAVPVIYGVTSHGRTTFFNTDDYYTRITGYKYTVIDNFVRSFRTNNLDLVAGVASADHQPVLAGDKLDSLSYSLQNYGVLSWNGPITAKFYLSEDPEIDASDILVGEEVFTDILLPGQIKQRTVRYQDLPYIPHHDSGLGHLIGPNYLGVILDVADGRTDNNTSYLPAEITIEPRRRITVRVATPDNNPLPEVTVNGPPDGPDETDADGLVMVFAVPVWSGILGFDKPGYDFSPATIAIDSSSTDQTVDVTATLRTHTIQGHVRLADGSGLSGVEIEGFPQGPIFTDRAGFFQAIVDWGTALNITPRKVWYNMSPASRGFFVDRDETVDFTATFGLLAESIWPQFNADASHTGRAYHISIRNRKSWEADVGSSHVSSVSTGLQGEVYVGNASGDLYAFSKFGNLLWRADLAAPIKGAPVAGSGELVYVVTGDGKMWVVDHTGSPSLLYDTQDPNVSGLTAGQHGIFYIAGDNLYAVAQDGLLVWTSNLLNTFQGQPAIGPDGTVYATAGVASSLYAYDPPSGALLWQAPLGVGASYKSPAVDDLGNIYVGAHSGHLTKVSPQGAIVWQAALGGDIQGSPAIDRHRNVYVGTANGDIFAIDPNGVQLWTDNVGTAVKSSPVISVHTFRRGLLPPKTEELLYVGADNGEMYSYSIEGQSFPKGTGARRWAFQASGAITGSPALSSGRLYFGAGSGTLYALQGIDRSNIQVATLFNDPALNPMLDSDILVKWDGVKEYINGLLGGPEDPCGGRLLILPPCLQDETFGFGSVSPFIDAVAGVPLLFDLITDADAIAVRAGEVDGVLASLGITFEPERQYAVVVGGLHESGAFAPNPDGRDAGLALFTYDGFPDAVETNQVHLFAGHFSTDASALSIELEGEASHTFEHLFYGDFSTGLDVPAGVYRGLLRDETGEIFTEIEFDLTAYAGQAIGLYAAGFKSPGENLGGPPIRLLVVPPEGRAGYDEGGLGKHVGIESIEVPESLELYQNYPNPFNSSTTITFGLPEATLVSLNIYDVLGRQVMRLLDGSRMAAGIHQVAFDASSLANGAYLYRIEANSHAAMKRMILLK